MPPPRAKPFPDKQRGGGIFIPKILKPGTTRGPQEWDKNFRELGHRARVWEKTGAGSV